MRTYSKKYAFILVALYIALQRTLPKLFTQKTMSREILLRLGLGLIAFCFVYLIVGKRVFSYFGKGTAYSINRLLVLCLPSFLLCAMALSLSEQTQGRCGPQLGRPSLPEQGAHHVAKSMPGHTSGPSPQQAGL